jgi:hypothetical protein
MPIILLQQSNNALLLSAEKPGHLFYPDKYRQSWNTSGNITIEASVCVRKFKSM